MVVTDLFPGDHFFQYLVTLPPSCLMRCCTDGSVKCEGVTTSRGGGAACDQCDEGYFVMASGDCHACPENALCSGGYSLPRPKAGFWSDRSSASLAADIYPCPYQTCVGAASAKQFCWERRSWDLCNSPAGENASQLCERGSFGPLCSICKRAWLMDQARQRCTRCPTSFEEALTNLPMQTLIIVAFCLMAMTWVATRACCGQASEAKHSVHEVRLMRSFIRRCKTKGRIVWTTLQV